MQPGYLLPNIRHTMIRYKLFNSGQLHQIKAVANRPDWHEAPLYAGNWGKYNINYQTRELPKPVTVDWITQEQIKNDLPIHPFTHATLGIESDQWFRPPFHVQVLCPFNYRSDILDSVWLLNDVDNNPTRELDLFESGRSWRKRLWFADHFGEPKYFNRRMDAVEILLPPAGINKIDIFVNKDSAFRYLNDRLVMITTADLNYDYRLLCTLIVNTPDAKDCNWKPEIYIG
jgi:hypothetical protein